MENENENFDFRMSREEAYDLIILLQIAKNQKEETDKELSEFASNMQEALHVVLAGG